MDSIREQIIKDLNTLCSKRLVLAVSGGLDSICLAHYFITNKVLLGLEWLGIAHVNHGLREVSADLDEALVRKFAAKYDIPFFCVQLDGHALKASEKSLEEAARDERYKALCDIAKSESKSQSTDEAKEPLAIVTAHHALDQAETVYMRLRRGTSLEGLKGMQRIVEKSYGNNSIKIFRPFLDISRAVLLEYAKKNQLTWREDESNSDVKFLRNKIRHVLLPNLEKQVRGASLQLSRIASLADNAYLKIICITDKLFTPAITTNPDGIEEILQSSKKTIALDSKKLRNIFNSIHKESAKNEQPFSSPELFRLWLSSNGFRFPIGFFNNKKNEATLKLPVNTAYRKRSIFKFKQTIIICEFKDNVTAQKFVSCK